jgi:lipopolysaccharide assembly protein A
MQFLKTLFWVLIAVIIALFTFANWTPITINLWNGLQLDTKLPVLLIGAFLTGLIPALLLHRATRWSLKRKIGTMERALADVRPPEPVTRPATAPSSTLPPAAVPMAVPPGVS